MSSKLKNAVLRTLRGGRLQQKQAAVAPVLELVAPVLELVPAGPGFGKGQEGRRGHLCLCIAPSPSSTIFAAVRTEATRANGALAFLTDQPCCPVTWPSFTSCSKWPSRRALLGFHL